MWKPTNTYSYNPQNELYHHGILGQKWGKKNGPPYPLDGSDHSAAEKKAGWKKSLNSNTSHIDKKKVKKSPDEIYKEYLDSEVGKMDMEESQHRSKDPIDTYYREKEASLRKKNKADYKTYKAVNRMERKRKVVRDTNIGAAAGTLVGLAASGANPAMTVTLMLAGAAGTAITSSAVRKGAEIVKNSKYKRMLNNG